MPSGIRSAEVSAEGVWPRARPASPAVTDAPWPRYGVRGRRGSEVDRQIPADETRRVDGRRVVPRPARRRIAGAVLIDVFVGRRVVRVQEVAEVDADIQAPPAESQNLCKSHVDLRPPVVGV